MVILPLSRAATGTGPRYGEIHCVFAHTTGTHRMPEPLPHARIRPVSSALPGTRRVQSATRLLSNNDDIAGVHLLPGHPAQHQPHHIALPRHVDALAERFDATIVVSPTTDALSAPTTTAASPLRHAHTGPRTKSTRSYHGVNTHWSEGIMERIEELSFDGIARGVPHHGNDVPRRPRRRWPIVLSIALTTLLLACGGAWAYWMWDHHWRLVPVRVNDATFKVRVDTTLGALLADNNDFGHKPGRLLAITGDVVDERGGEPMTVTLNGSPVTAESFDGTPLPEPATVTVTSGGDVTEGYDVRHDPVPHGADVGSGGSIQRLVRTGKDGVREVWVGRSSKKEVDKGVIEQPVDLVVEAINPRPAGRKVIALTFDDGRASIRGGFSTC